MDNFDLRISDLTSHTVRVAVVHSPAGEVAPMEVDIARASLESLIDLPDAELRGVAADYTIQTVPDPVWQAWRESVSAAGSAGIRLRIRYEDPHCGRLPWELFYDADKQYFLAHDPRSPMVRYLEGPISGTAEPIEGPLRVLLTCASPTDEKPLQVRAELDGIEEALSKAIQGGTVEVTRVDDLTLDALDRALIEVKPHIVHFSGHGTWDERADSGYLVLDDGHGNSDTVPHLVLAMLLRNRGVALAVLNACETALGDAAWAGLAQSLVLEGVPAVVAMQTVITDRAAIAFGGTLFAALANSYSPEQAVTLARQSVARQPKGVARAAEWLIPVLFMREGSEQFWMREGTDEAGLPVSGIANSMIDTGGGTFVSGEFEAGGDINIGASPEQFADMLDRLFGLMLQIPRAHNQLLGARSMLETARQQVGRLAEYKEMHDLLQQLESSYLVIYSLIYDEGELLAAAQVRWRSLKQSRGDLESRIQRLCLYADSVSFAEDMVTSRAELERASDDMQSAFEERDLLLLDALLADVQHVINTQTPRMNDRLIGAVDGLQMNALAQRLADMHGDLIKARTELGQEQIEQLAAFTDDMTGLVRLADRLTELRFAHDRWQQADNELRTQLAGLPTSGRRFPSYWQRSLRQRLSELVENPDDEQERGLAANVAAVDAALEGSDPFDLIDAVDDCRRTVLRRLNQIDHNLRTLCTVLNEAGGPLDTLLERLE